jgi:hypothetical protein
VSIIGTPWGVTPHLVWSASVQPHVASSLESTGGAQPFDGHGGDDWPILQLFPLLSHSILGQKRVEASPSAGML